MLFTVTQWEDRDGTSVCRNTWKIQALNASVAVLKGIPFEDTLEGEFRCFKFHGEYRSPKLLVRAVAD